MNLFRQKCQRLVLPSVLLSACLHLLIAFVPESFGELIFGLSKRSQPLTHRLEIVSLAPEPAPQYVESSPGAGRGDTRSALPPPSPPPLRSSTPEGDSILPHADLNLESVPLPEMELSPELSFSPAVRAADSSQVLDSYLDVVFKRLALAKRYPETARRMGQQGEVTLSFAIARNGSLEDGVELAAPCRFGALNRSAVDCVKRGAPFPPLPEYVLAEHLRLTVRISFNLDQ